MTDESLFLPVMAELRQRYEDFNRVEVACGLPRLEDADLTWTERVLELERRVIVLGTWAKGEPNLAAMDTLLDTIGATVIVMKLAIAKAQAETVGEAA